MVKGLSIKDVRSQGEFVQCGHFSDKGSFFKCERPHFLVQKSSNFSKFMVCPHGQRELSQCGHFSDKGGERVNFSRFCADVFYGLLIIFRYFRFFFFFHKKFSRFAFFLLFAKTQVNKKLFKFKNN